MSDPSDDIEDELEAVGDDEEEATRLAYRRVLHRSSVIREVQTQFDEWQQKQDWYHTDLKVTNVSDMSAPQAKRTATLILREADESELTTVGQFIRQLIESDGFDRVIMTIIILNSLLMAIETGFTTGSSITLFTAFALRSLRALRSVSFVRSLRVIVTALIRTMGSILNLLGLLGLLMYVFAIMGYYFYGPDINLDVSTLSDAEARFSSLGSAFIVLWSYVTADGWAFFQYELDARGFTNSRFYSVFFVFIGAFIFTNLFIGIILQNLDEATSEDLTLQDAKRMLLSRLKKKMLQQRQQHDLRRLMAIQQSHPEVSMPQILATLAGKLSDDEQVPLTHTLFDLTWLECFSTTLRLQEQTLYRQQQLHFEVAATLSELWESKQECVYDPWTALPNAAEFDMFLDDDISENVAQTRQNDQDFELYNGNTDNDAEEQGHVFDFRIHSRSVSKAPPRDVLSPSHSTQLGWQYDSTRYQTDQHAPSDIAYRSAASAPRHHARVDSSAGAFLDLIQQPLPAIEAFPALPIASSSTAHRTQRVLRSICASAIDQPTLPDQMASINENDDVFFSEETPKQEGSKKEI